MSFLGDTIPKYRDLLINSVLTGAYDSDGLVRASVIVTVVRARDLLINSV